MSIQAIVIAALVVGGVGLFIGFFLGVFGEKFKVETDPREESILDALPGNNCGGCGYAGCSGLAAAIVSNEAPVNGCPVGGNPVASEIAKIMGTESVEGKREVAFVTCAGTREKAVQAFDYYGIQDCSAMEYIPNKGPKGCSFGCLGFGNCVRACPFDAIHVKNGVAEVDPAQCKACMKCVAACPKHLIIMVPAEATNRVACGSFYPGKEVQKFCSTGCIGCKKCEVNCPHDAVHVHDNLAKIDQSKCTQCGICAQKCPKHIIL